MDPWHCNGCHGGDFADFDHFCDVTGVQPGEEPVAFGVWLSGPQEKPITMGRLGGPQVTIGRKTEDR